MTVLLWVMAWLALTITALWSWIQVFHAMSARAEDDSQPPINLAEWLVDRWRKR